MSTEVVEVTGEAITGSASVDGTTINATLEGNADSRALDAIEMLLSRMHAEAKRLGVGQVVVDLQRLEFMNSSCFKCFISWMTDIQELPEPAQYKVTFLSNARLHWQKRSLHSLRSFAVDLVTVTEA